MSGERVIIHVDMDAFFAAIEQRDDPSIAGKPVVVGADPKGGKGRGVVSTCSYEARRFGVHSAQPISQAYRLCPDAVFLPVDGAKYERESQRIRAIFDEFTPQVEPVSVDEAFLDVTGCLRLFGGKRALAERLRERIEAETHLTASLGVARNKLVAKIASDLEKPRGLVIVEPGREVAFLAPLEVRRLPGVGRRCVKHCRPWACAPWATWRPSPRLSYAGGSGSGGRNSTARRAAGTTAPWSPSRRRSPSGMSTRSRRTRPTALCLCAR